MQRTTLFSSESVTEGHPDKVCDQISDAVLDAMLAQDPDARVACETCATTGVVFVMGEITTKGYVDIPTIVRKTVCRIGYDSVETGFDGNTCAVLTAINEQSADIAMGVDRALETRQTDGAADIGAGDQGMMFGYACDQTPQLMPLAIMLSHDLTRRLAQCRRDGSMPYLLPDGKAMVTVEYEDDRPVRVDSIVVSAQHRPEVSMQELTEGVKRNIIMQGDVAAWVDEKTRILVNPTGRFCVGGPTGDSGLTGRKLIVDTYGGYCRHGGGAFSGKDPTKVDRSASYAARYVAKNIVAAGLASRCEVMLAYAIGVAQPVAVQIDCFGTNKVPVERIAQAVRKVFDLRPAAIIERLQLRRPIYEATAAYGHFGRDIFPWENCDCVEQLQRAL
jgi:S-adenosylmethionine synthetase